MDKMKVMLAKEYEINMIIKKDLSKYSKPPKGWIMSEKFDGYRCLFFYEEINGIMTGVFISRNNKRFNYPHQNVIKKPNDVVTLKCLLLI